MRRMSTIVPYNPEWPALFNAEAAGIHRALEKLAVRVEHVGSTSVLGLAAKSVIDMQVSVPDLADLGRYMHPLARVGYRHVPLGDIDLVYPFFQKPPNGPSTHHVHLCVVGSEHERRHLVFRDYLRDHPSVCAKYVELKRTLALANDGSTLESRERYSLSKSEFITDALSRAFTEGYGSP